MAKGSTGKPQPPKTAAAVRSRSSTVPVAKSAIPRGKGAQEESSVQVLADELKEDELLAVKTAPQRHIFDDALSDPEPSSGTGEDASSTPLIDGCVSDAVAFPCVPR